jgi:peptidoglycan hydrolase CwlO-like protein
VATIAEMAEAHLLNVEREINNLNARKGEIDKEIDRLQAYLQEGRATLLEAQSTQEVVPQVAQPQSANFSHQGRATVFNPTQ